MGDLVWVDPPMDFGSGDVTSVEAELAELRHMGLSIGLTLADVEDTVSVWTDWWGVDPATHLDFGTISRSLAKTVNEILAHLTEVLERKAAEAPNGALAPGLAVAVQVIRVTMETT